MTTLDELYASLRADAAAVAQAAHEATVASLQRRFADYRAAQLPPETTVRAGESLQAALLAGGRVRLEAGVTHAGTVTLPPGARLTLGPGAGLRAGPGPCLRVPVGGVNADIEVVGEDGATIGSTGEIVVLLGENTTRQTTLDSVPRDIRLRGLTCPTHRGKRVFEINATAVLLEQCWTRDQWDPELSDSQAIGILNSPGDVTVRGGLFEGCSENILIGGAWMKLVGVHPKGFLFDGLTLTKPPGWRTDGVKRAIKNLFELKDAEDVVLTRSLLEHHWQDAQPGWAVVFTPRKGGSVRNVTVSDCAILDVPAGINITGHNTGADEVTAPTPFHTANLTLRNLLVVTARGLGGNGVFAQLTNGGCDGLTVSGVRAITHGSSLVVAGDKEECGSLVMSGCHAHAGQYGFFTAGRINALEPLYRPPNPDGSGGGGYGAFSVEGNVFTDHETVLARSLPRNTFLARPAFDALFVDPASGDWTLRPTP